MVKKIFVVALLLCSGLISLAQSNSSLWIHSTSPQKSRNLNSPVIATFDQFEIRYKHAETFEYFGGLYISDTVTKLTKTITIPILYSDYLSEAGEFVKRDGEIWFFIVKSGRTDGNILAGPSDSERKQRIEYEFKFSSRDFGDTWEIERI